MKVKSVFKPIIFFFFFLSIVGCSSTNQLRLTVPQPAPVYIPKNIKNIGVLDRTLSAKANKPLDDLDKILSLEGKNLDKEGANEAVQGLYYELQKNSNFADVQILDNASVATPGLGVFPAALSWEEVEKIAAQNNARALFVVSFYDTEAKVNYSSVTKTVANPLGIKIPIVEHIATINTIVKIGFRIYDLDSKVILDEFITNRNVVTEGRGINPLKAVEAVMNRKQSVLRLSKDMGEDYAFRILPYSERVSRDYYVR